MVRYLPYLRRRMRLKYTLAAVGVVGIIFLLFQMKWIQELTSKAFSRVPPVRGVHFKLAKYYSADINHKFTCLIDREIIDFDKVNDDYCDCDDGTDEPGTSACPSGFFCCESDIFKRKVVLLPSGRVNDGICDCCDGSDEWLKRSFPLTLPDKKQHLPDSSDIQCPNTC